jgi:hypothetical protein
MTVDLRDYTRRKLNLLDRAGIDLRLTDQDYRVLAYVAKAVDQETELARRKQQTIASDLGKKSVRGIQLSLGRLQQFGYIKFETKDGGTYVNAYRLMLEKTNDGSPLGNEKANGYSSSIGKRRTETPKKANGNARKGEPPFVHDPFISLEIPSAREPAIARALGSLAGDLAAKIGRDHFHSWLGKAAVTDVVGDTLTLAVPTKLTAERVRFDYGPALLDCCAKLVPAIKFIHVVVAARAGATA